jgi:hypothetical protein
VLPAEDPVVPVPLPVVLPAVLPDVLPVADPVVLPEGCCPVEPEVDPDPFPALPFEPELDPELDPDPELGVLPDAD